MQNGVPESKASKYLTALYFWFYITVGSTNQPLDAVDVWTDAVALKGALSLKIWRYKFITVKVVTEALAGANGVMGSVGYSVFWSLTSTVYRLKVRMSQSLLKQFKTLFLFPSSPSLNWTIPLEE